MAPQTRVPLRGGLAVFEVAAATRQIIMALLPHGSNNDFFFTSCIYLHEVHRAVVRAVRVRVVLAR